MLGFFLFRNILLSGPVAYAVPLRADPGNVLKILVAFQGLNVLFLHLTIELDSAKYNYHFA